jgi:hypothetical protein
MARPKRIIDAALAEEAESALKETPEYKIGLRLQAIISSAQYPITLVSKVQTDRITLRRWIKRFTARGIDGLADAPNGHRPSCVQYYQDKATFQNFFVAGSPRPQEVAPS